jgi:glycosyltransferase involved in cell wall biosynthesis
LNILKNLEKQDSRIKIINNKNNSGLLFSRGMGILNSKGEYIMCLDPDDQIRGPKDLKYLYSKAKTLNLDIISFNILYVPKRVKSGNFFGVNRIIRQPELYQNAFDANGYLNDFYVTNKLVKNKLFKNAFQIFRKYIYGKKWNFHEDNIWSILIYKYSNSYLFVNKIIYIYYQNKDSLMENRRNDLELENLLMRHEIYKEIFKNKGEEKYLIHFNNSRMFANVTGVGKKYKYYFK